jgi:hypothetical protein
MVKVGEHKIENNKTGWKFASSEEGVTTGERGDRVILDDPHNVVDIDSEEVMASTVTWFRTAMSNRLNDAKRSAIIIVMQRLRENDVSGDILSRESPYCHWIDPRALDDDGDLVTLAELEERSGELAWPDRIKMRRIAEPRGSPNSSSA